MHGLQENIRQKNHGPLIFWVLALITIILDQVTKFWTLNAIGPQSEAFLTQGFANVGIIPRLLRFQYAENTGAAFSLFTRHPGILTWIASVLAVAVAVWAYLLPRHERMSRFALGLVFGGAIGNLVDRFRCGFVIDFIQFHWDGRPLFPTFNVADSAICIGIGIFFLSSWLSMRQVEKVPGEIEEKS